MAVDGQAAPQVWGVSYGLSGTIAELEAAPKPLSIGSPQKEAIGHCFGKRN